ncbi:uncharacterized protein BXIN_0590 [Babesia sp. Xinjiang]|uniref:uncharacterized protein n=1 Tax=Babesia sp. Xinjiang TaxID=462227 RepID=UPI000A25C5D7|nr:uncharacterized protein BXIN_0590 [Babesia sp. Xinjiang]ORM41807.1 hypothetical protein BXIN_0590 [Babesia sp. Xinjiang]
MSRFPPGLPFRLIPHFEISTLLDPKDIIIVNNQPQTNVRRTRSANSADCTERAAKHRRTNGGSVSVPRTATTPVDLQRTVMINSTLKPELPTRDVDLFEFKDSCRRAVDRLHTLREDATKLKAEDLKSDLGMDSAEDAASVYKLRTNIQLMSCLRQPLRAPTITEVIRSAANMNVSHILVDRCPHGRPRRRRIDIPVAANNIAWSEKRLHNLYAASVNLHSYQLAIGARRYTHPEISPESDASRPMLLRGPQNRSNAPMFHHHAMQRHLEQRRRSALTLVSDDELIVTVSMYHGVRGHKLREYDMLSCQRLSDLRDVFRCPAEIRPVGVNLGVQGSCFMLNGQLFPDLRNGACDYSEPLLHYLLKYKPGILRTSECVEQSDAVICHLELPVYSPGFLLHHGDCEHRFVITAVRAFVRGRDCPYEQCYPVSVFTPRQRSIPCQVCEGREAKISVFNSLVLPHVPNYLCEECYKRFTALNTPTGVYRSNGLAPTTAVEFPNE